MYVYVCMYIYIYIYIHIYIYIYISPAPPLLDADLVQLPLDDEPVFRRVSTRGFSRGLSQRILVGIILAGRLGVSIRNAL